MSGVEDLEAILLDEHDVLTQGRYEDLPDLVARKEAALRRGVSVSDADPASLARLSKLAGQNALLIEAAHRGLEAGRDELRAIRKGFSQATYGKDGARQPLARLPGHMERKV